MDPGVFAGANAILKRAGGCLRNCQKALLISIKHAAAGIRA
ncbi:hypothetical protein MuYL_0473 [Mucilaginibacter xinganensis]|uniref:Uncharacterized protein n=1 Tax=Mucilaginibacter xinganensis TaxID=1234841 RepID=A0A223NRE8_9SPHI|nr:hypothetical protein MuYL_0473 [Mucilaginibacter xinganensis]